MQLLQFVGILFRIYVIFGLSTHLLAQDVVEESQLIVNQYYSLDDVDRKTRSTHFKIPIPTDFLAKFERIDAMFISSWVAITPEASESYNTQSAALDPPLEEGILYYANGHPEYFRYEREQTGFGVELILTDRADSMKCIQRYRRKKIRPAGFWSCVLYRQNSTSPTLFHYRYPLSRALYIQEPKTIYAYLRSSDKITPLELELKMVLTIKGVLKPKN